MPTQGQPPSSPHGSNVSTHLGRGDYEHLLYTISGEDMTELSLPQVSNTRVYEASNPVEASLLHTPYVVPSLPWNRPHNPLGLLILHGWCAGPWENYTDFPTEVWAWGLHWAAGRRGNCLNWFTCPVTGRLHGYLRESALTWEAFPCLMERDTQWKKNTITGRKYQEERKTLV